MSNEDHIRLLHKRDAAVEAIGFAGGKTKTDLDADRMRTLALTRTIEIIGEAAAVISPETRDTYPQIPWRILVGMRNRLVHAYFDVNTAILLSTAHDDLPRLIDTLDGILGNGTLLPPLSESS